MDEELKEVSNDQTVDPNLGAAFEADLDALLFDGPSLPSDFSRTDIYADHD